MTEQEFQALAWSHLQANPLCAFLDSAGPLGPRSNFCFLTGRIFRVFIQNGNYLQAINEAGALEGPWPIQRFSGLVEDILHGRRQTALFPLITYEAFNPYIAPEKPHPIWQCGEAIWLEAQDWLCFDRRKERCYGYLNEDWSQDRLFGAVQTLIPTPAGRSPAPGWRESEAEYDRKISIIKEDIYNGNYYQANFSRRFFGESGQNPQQTYQNLREKNPSPFMGVFRYGPHWVLSCSPERLVQRQGSGLSARPIAGTKPRFSDPGADQASKDELQQSEKERAEHLMLVDLVRNDLGRVAVPGSVHVEEFCTIETYAHVHHLVSGVVAQQRPESTLIQLIQAVFPGGTITGAPKISCMRRLAQLEEEARGPYTGAIGIVAPGPYADLNILIRTIIQREQRICCHGGGGIVADSLASPEFQETRHKCRALFEALNLSPHQ